MHILNDAENQDKDRRDSKAGEVREGQADSSIRHDSKDNKDEELPRKIENDDRALSQQEFIDDDKNNNKASE